jgi:pyridoxamine 5'-phosphate oxidase
MAREDLDVARARLMTAGLSEEELPGEPIELFGRWFELASGLGVHEPGAVTLATIDEQGDPDARVVLLRAFDLSGFVFYTDRSSAKGRQLARVPRAAMVVLWAELSRQVRVVGAVSPATEDESDAYWGTRPRGSQLAAVVSHQSTVLRDRAELEARYAAADAAWADRPIERPARWGGYRLVPERVEFWQGRDFRAHDRLRDQRSPAGPGWRIERLSP